MATAARFPMESLYPLQCDSANVLEGAVLVQGVNTSVSPTCALPSGASSVESILGLAYVAGSSSANGPMTIVGPGAVWPGIAAGTIVAGDELVIGGATGTVVAVSLTTPASATRVGVAMESAVAGSRVPILIGASKSLFSGTVLKMTAGVGGTVANTIVIAADGTAVLPGGASPTSAILGVALNTAIAGAPVYVVTSGSAVVTCGSGAGVTANDRITSNGTGGFGFTAAPGAGTNCAYVGIALNTVAANGAITVSVCPGTVQG